MGLGIPWCWRIGPSNSSERQHCREMLESEIFLENTLFCGDAGFVGYDFWQAIHATGNAFLIRVGGNVRLLKNLGYVRRRKGIVYCWPDGAMRKKQHPLAMRLLELHDGRKPIYVVTSVLDKRELSDSLVQKLYQLRWGIEVAFRDLKQTFGRRKLRSRRADRVAVELEWSLLGLGVLQLMAIEQQPTEASPLRISTANTQQAVRECLEWLRERPEQHENLPAQLARATIDDY